MKNGVHSHFPRSHEAADHFQLSVPDMVLEQDVVGETYSPGRFDHCGGNLVGRRAVASTLMCGFAEDRRVAGGASVSRGVGWWGVLCWGVLCGAVLTGGVGAGGVMLRGVKGRCVVRRWGACAVACVLGHGVLVAVLHPCRSDSSASPPP